MRVAVLLGVIGTTATPASAFPAAEGFGKEAADAVARPHSIRTPKKPVPPKVASELSALFLVETTVEYEWLAAQLSGKQTTSIEEVEVTSGTLSGKRVAVVESGIGKMAAAEAALTVLEKLRPRAVFSTGIAGSLAIDTLPGDVVIAGSVGFHDSGVAAAGFTAADPTLVARARRLVASVAPPPGARRERRVILARITSGDAAITSSDRATAVRAAHQSIAADSEAAALALVCRERKIPYLAVRGISHRAGEGALSDAARYADLAAEASIRVAAALIY